MTDYKNLKLIATSNPHIRSSETTRSIMLDVIIALLPALAWAVYSFGFKALLLTVISVVACVFWEWAYRKVMKKPQSIGDLSAVVTGMLLALVCPVTIPYWILLIGDFFAIVIVKQLFGGIGKNFINPALVGRAMLGDPWIFREIRAALAGRPLPPRPTPEEIAAIRAAATGEDRALIEIGLRTGLRLGDACRLDWSAFRANGVLDVVTGKTGAEVVLPSAGLLAALAEAGFARKERGPVLPRTAAAYTSGKSGPTIVSDRIGRVFEAAGVARTIKASGWKRARAETGFHSLRHTFVTRAIEAGVPAPIVRALVGHASAAMTDRYSHVGSAAVLEAFSAAAI